MKDAVNKQIQRCGQREGAKQHKRMEGFEADDKSLLEKDFIFRIRNYT